MANRERGEWLWNAGGRSYCLRLSTSSCCELETITGGRSLEQVIEGVNAGWMLDIRWLAWTALRDWHRDIAVDGRAGVLAVGRLIDTGGGLVRIREALRSLVAINAAADEPGLKAPSGQSAKPSGPRTWRDLYVDALTSGMTPDQFWSLSLRELWNVGKAERERELRRHNRDVIHAWQVERVSIMAAQPDGGRKLPRLDKLLHVDGRRGSNQPRNREEQRALIYAMSAAYGIPVQRMKKNASGQYETVH
jgi:hypothetical protein